MVWDGIRTFCASARIREAVTRRRDMESLDLQLRVSDHPLLDSDTRKIVNDIRVFEPLSHNAQAKFLKNINIGSGSLVLQVQEAAVIIDEQWVVSIHAHKLRQCVSAMAVLLNSLGEEMASRDARISIQILERVHDDGLPLDLALERQERMERIAGYLESAVFLLFGVVLSGLAGLAIAWLSTKGALP